MRRQKILNLFLVMVLLMGMLPMSAFPSIAFAEGEVGQTTTDVIEVADQDDLAAMKGTGSYKLANDITLDNWTPVDFNGTLDGNGYTITLSGTPLFNTLNGTLKNLLLDGKVISEQTTGALAVTMTGGLIQNSWSGASVTVTKMLEKAAGLVGLMSGGRTHNVFVSGELIPGKYGSVFGIATHGNNIASFDNSYWTEGKAQLVAQSIKGVTDSKLVTASDNDEMIDLLNGTVAVIPGLKAWIEQNGIPKPIGEISDGSTQIDKSELQSTLLKEQDYSSADYTSVTWNRFQDAIVRAKKILDDPQATQRAVSNEVIHLNRTIEELITTKNYESLTKELAKTESMIYDYEEYTSASWQEMWVVKNAADTVHKNASSTNSKGMTDADVLKAYNELADSIRNLVKIPWIEIITAEELSTINDNAQYILTADITGYKGNRNTFSGKLDGNGHTIAFAADAKPLFHTIAEGAEVRNVGLTGKVTGSGAFAEILSGKIFNSYSWADVDGKDTVAGGIAGVSASSRNNSASIINTYVNGTVISTETYGALIGSSDRHLSISNSFYVNGENSVGNGDTDSTGTKITADEMKKEDFSILLNKKTGKYGLKWNRDEEGLPYFGSEAAPQGDFYPVVMTSLVDSTTQTINSKTEELTTSVFGLADGYVATLALKDYDGEIEWKTISSQDNSPITVVSISSKVFVRGPGTVTVKAMDATTKEVIQSFTMKSEIPKNFDLTLLVNGYDLTNKDYFTPGSENFEVIPMVTINNGQPFKVLPSLFKWTSDNRSIIRVYDDGYAEAKDVGTATITVSLGNVNKTITITGGYTAVETIKPAFSGEYIIHGRSPNSIGQNDTPGVASFNPLRNADKVGSEFHIAQVTPTNATYAKDYTTTTDNTDVLVYKGSMQNSLLPLKEGTVKLTVTSNDPKKNPKPKGTSEVTIKYFNPLENLTLKTDTLTVKKGQSVDAGLLFKGPESVNGFHVTESNMIWTQTGTGEVSAYQSYPVIMVHDEASLREGTVSNDQWLIRGVKEGTVTLTGTPVDSGHGAKPVTLTITVIEGETVVVKPAKELVREVLTNTMEYQAAQIGTPEFGDEWTILGLARADYKAPADFYETFYASVYDKVTTEAAKTANRFGDSVTDVQRLALALTAIGKDPRDVNGVNLLNYNWNKAANFPGIKPNGILGKRQGSNELIFALLAVEANNKFEQPSDASITIEEMINRLIAEYQMEDGSFGLSDNQSSSVDMTAMAIQALAKHQDIPAAKEAAEKAVAKLATMQGVEGSYGTSESTSQVILALLEMGIDPQTDERFTKGLSSLLDGQMTYSNPDGSFAHSFGGTGNPIATDQAFYTFTALDRFYNGKNSLYNMNDVTLEGADKDTAVTGVNVTPTSSQLEVGKYVQLGATVLPAEAKDKSVTWSSDNTNIATVSKDGLVTAIAAGTATITVTTNNDRTATAVITVVTPTTKPTEKDKATLSVEKRTIGKGDVISNTSITIEKGDTAFTALKRLMDEKGISIRYTGLGSTLYVQAIAGDGEFDHGQGSGWMYSVNGVFPEYSAGLYSLKKGDVLRWQYTKNLGADLGNKFPETKPEPKPEKPPVVEAPKNIETVIKDDKVVIQVKDEKTGQSQPAKVEKNEVVGGFLIVQIGGKGQEIQGGIKLPEGSTKIVVLDNDKPYEYFDIVSETKPNKEWNVDFSGPLLDNTENLDKVVVQNAAGEKVDMKVKLSADGKTVSIQPSKNYEKGELYYITISDVTSASGKKLKQDIRKIFIVE